MGAFFFFITLFPFMGLNVYVPLWIKRRIIKHKHSRQLMAMQEQARNPLKMAKHPIGKELVFSMAFFFSSGGLFISMLFIAAVVDVLFYGNTEHLQYVIDRFILYTLLFYLLDLAVFYIRMATGHIQGAVLYDTQDRKFYAFQSVNSDCYSGGYKEYHESELVYSTYWGGGRAQLGYQFIFFTADEGKKAFTIWISVFQKENDDLISMMSTPKPDFIPIPLTLKNFIFAFIYIHFSIASGYLIVDWLIGFDSFH